MVHIVWKWEFLSRCLGQVTPIWCDVVQFFDVLRLLRGASSRPLNAKVVTNLAAVIIRKPDFEILAEIVRAAGKALDT